MILIRVEAKELRFIEVFIAKEQTERSYIYNVNYLFQDYLSWNFPYHNIESYWYSLVTFISFKLFLGMCF